MDMKSRKRRILWESEEEEVVVVDTPIVIEAKTQVAPPVPDAPNVVKSGNGHKKTKVRDLNDSERSCITTIFQNVGGMFQYKDCTKKILPLMGSDIAIYQVTGFISQIHVSVYKGTLEVADRKAYFAFMAEKYPKIHARYIVKYPQLDLEDVPEPKFAAGVPTGKLS